MHEHSNFSPGKNLSQYSPIGVWLTIALEALVQSEFECPKYLSHSLPLAIEGVIGCILLL